MKNRKGYKIFNFIMKLISWCIIAILSVIGIFLIIYLIINKTAQSKGETAPLGLYTIISPSMTPEIDVYDVVLVVHKDPEDIEVGDIISYYSTNDYFGEIPITHRVVEKFNTNNGVTFRTRGDANPVVDNEIIFEENVIGTVRFRIPQLGRIQFFLASKGGWFLAILVPAAGIIIYDIIKLIKLITVKGKIKYAEDLTKSEKNLKNSNELYDFEQKNAINSNELYDFESKKHTESKELYDFDKNNDTHSNDLYDFESRNYTPSKDYNKEKNEKKQDDDSIDERIKKLFEDNDNDKNF